MKFKKINIRNILLNKDNLTLKTSKKYINKSFINHNNTNKIPNYKKFFKINDKINLKLINNKSYHEYNFNNDLSTISSSKNILSSLYDLNKSKYENTFNGFNYSTLNNFSTVNAPIQNIIQNFEQNKNTTKMLIDKENKYQLNSLNNMTEKNIEFLLSENYIHEENKRSKTINNESDTNILSYKLIKLFNIKTNKILNSSENTLRNFNTQKSHFGLDLINNYQKIEFNKTVLHKLKQKYSQANDIVERMIENKIKRAKKLEKDFYTLKNEENNNKIKNKKLLLNSERFKRGKSILFFKKGAKANIRRLSLNQAKNLNEDEKLSKAHLAYNKYINKKVKINAELFDEKISKLIKEKNQIKNSIYLDERTKKIKMIYQDIIKSKQISKIQYEKKEDEYKSEYNNLKKMMNHCEDEYYRVNVYNNKNYKLRFLKPILKLKTIKKFMRIKDSNFGTPN